MYVYVHSFESMSAWSQEYPDGYNGNTESWCVHGCDSLTSEYTHTVCITLGYSMIEIHVHYVYCAYYADFLL